MKIYNISCTQSSGSCYPVSLALAAVIMNVASFGDQPSCTTATINSIINHSMLDFCRLHIHVTGYILNHSCLKGIIIIHVYMFVYNIFTSQ